MTKAFLTFVTLVIVNCAFANPWCDVVCDNLPGPHVFCNYSPNVVSPSCGTVVQSQLTQQDISDILNTHNNLRQKVANGQESQGNPGPQPAATNIPDLVWDNTLASMAQAWVNQCPSTHRCSHLGNNWLDKVGQNMGQVWSNRQYISFETVIQKWYKEVAKFNRNNVNNFVGHKSTNHYSQLVWAQTTKVGCGGLKYMKNEYHYTHLVCNYGPTGNVRGSSVYETTW